MFNVEKVPFYNIPDLNGFKLKPYVAHITPKIGDLDIVKRKITIDEVMMKSIEHQIKNAPQGSLVTTEKLDPLSRLNARR